MSIAQLTDRLTREYGAVIGGRKLRQVLGFESATAFGRAVRAGHLNVRLFDLPGRRGRFVLAEDLAIWLENQAKTRGKTVTQKCESLNLGGSEM